MWNKIEVFFRSCSQNLLPNQKKEEEQVRLYISKNIIEAHGGKIWASNNNTGKGCTFGFSLSVVNC